jgi:hypothetical protein
MLIAQQTSIRSLFEREQRVRNSFRNASAFGENVQTVLLGGGVFGTGAKPASDVTIQVRTQSIEVTVADDVS